MSRLEWLSQSQPVCIRTCFARTIIKVPFGNPNAAPFVPTRNAGAVLTAWRVALGSLIPVLAQNSPCGYEFPAVVAPGGFSRRLSLSLH